MRTLEKIAAIVLVLLLGAAVYGLFRTREPSDAARNNNNATPSDGAPRGPVVDQTPLLTAEKLARMPATAEERPLAEEGLHLADHKMDLAYAAAERELEEHPPVSSPEAKQIQPRLKAAEDALDADNALVERLTAEEAKASGAKKDEVHDQLVLATAHQGEHQDEVDDAKADLNRAGGDPKSLIEAMVEEHKVSSQAVDSMQVLVSPVAEERGLIESFRRWLAIHQKQLILQNAKQEAESRAAALSEKHNALEAQIRAEKTSTSESGGPPKATQGSAGVQPGAKLSREDSAALISTAKRRSADQRILSSLDKQIDDEKHLADNYGKWIAVEEEMQRSVMHRVFIGLTIILGILLIGVFFDGWLGKILSRMSMDRRQVETLRTVTRVTIQVLAVLLILLVIFGPPTQLATFLGLAGAGLTVALKDFIVGFLGWFVLMGKNGIRLGDWVEINGVTGEVVELGMFHTVLLETGNWTDSGHPTGRRVTFTNSFAIEGHYFNFSTSGQWLWDELQVVLPAGRDPYPMVDAIQKKVLEATSETAKQAEKEWQGVTRSSDVAHTLTAGPAINVKPVVGGVEIAVRYITRANERYQMRAKLNQAAVDLLGREFVAPPAASAEPVSKPA
jgi:small-conductance mechanosensitive channel